MTAVLSDASSNRGNTRDTPGPVLFLLSSLIRGGSEGKAVRVVNALHRKGWDVHLGYLNPPTTLLADLCKEVPVVHLGRRGKLSLAAIRKLLRYLRRKAISQLVCVNLYPALYGHAASNLLRPAARPAVLQLVNRTEHVGVKARVAMLLYAPLLRRASKVVFGCHAQLELWCARYRLQKGRCIVIYNGVDENRFAARSDAAETVSGRDPAGSEFVIGTVGTLRKQKNHFELISALAHLQNSPTRYELLIVGEGPERSQLERAIRERGLEDRISLPGEVDDVRPMLDKMDVFVLTSITETFSNATLEAMSTGKAVILSDTGGAREMVSPGISGYLYPPGDAGRLASLIEHLAQNPEARHMLGTNARTAVLERFTSTRMLEEYERMLL